MSCLIYDVGVDVTRKSKTSEVIIRQIGALVLRDPSGSLELANALTYEHNDLLNERQRKGIQSQAELRKKFLPKRKTQ